MWKRVASNYIDAEPEFDSSSAIKDFVDSSNYDDTGRFTNFNPNVIKRSVSKIYVWLPWI